MQHVECGGARRVGGRTEGVDDDPGAAQARPVGVGDRRAHGQGPQDGAQVHRPRPGGAEVSGNERGLTLGLEQRIKDGREPQCKRRGGLNGRRSHDLTVAGIPSRLVAAQSSDFAGALEIPMRRHRRGSGRDTDPCCGARWRGLHADWQRGAD